MRPPIISKKNPRFEGWMGLEAQTVAQVGERPVKVGLLKETPSEHRDRLNILIAEFNSVFPQIGMEDNGKQLVMDISDTIRRADQAINEVADTGKTGENIPHLLQAVEINISLLRYVFSRLLN